MDLKTLGYLISTISVLFLGIQAWPKPGEPAWQAWLIALGMATSIGGMFLRYLSHRKEKHEIHRAEAKAERG